jgi:hypothetical protein
MNQFQMPSLSDYRRCEVILHLGGYGVYQDLLGNWHSRAAPVPHIVGIERNAEEICGYESKLRGS